jgi:hypothetical protein
MTTTANDDCNYANSNGTTTTTTTTALFPRTQTICSTPIFQPCQAYMLLAPLHPPHLPIPLPRDDLPCGLWHLPKQTTRTTKTTANDDYNYDNSNNTTTTTTAPFPGTQTLCSTPNFQPCQAYMLLAPLHPASPFFTPSTQ